MTTNKNENKEMFVTIADQYDLINHLFSFNLDKLWRKRVVNRAPKDGVTDILDCCTGTGDQALAFARQYPAAQVQGVDIAEKMLDKARMKLKRVKTIHNLVFSSGDTCALPFKDNSFDLVSISFGLRNLWDMEKGVKEMARVLKPRGQLLILEFSPEQHFLIRLPYRFFLHNIIPFLGRRLSGSGHAYNYLSRSITEFIDNQQVVKLMEGARLSRVTSRSLSGGIVCLYSGWKNSDH